MLELFFRNFFIKYNDRVLHKLGKIVFQINSLEKFFSKLSNIELKKKHMNLKFV